MKTKAEGLDLTQGRGASKHPVSVRLSQLAFEALVGDQRHDSAPARAASAVRVYLSDKGAGRLAWPYPGFLRGSETQDEVGLELDVAPDLWLQFEAEAGRQSVSAQQLLEHAAFYFAAELDAGRITQRILEDLDSGQEQSGGG